MKKITKTLLGLSVAALLASCGCAQQTSSSSSSHDTGLSSSESSKQTGLSSSESTHQTGLSSSDTTPSTSSESTQSTQSSESTQSTGTSESSQSSESSESSSQPAAKTVVAVVGGVDVPLVKNETPDPSDVNLKEEYYVTELDVMGDQSIIIKIDGVEISQNIGPDAYAEGNNLKKDDLGNILVVNNAEDASLYFKVYESGYSLYLSGLDDGEETVLYNLVTDDLGTEFGLTESATTPQGWDAQYESDKIYLSPLDYMVIKGVKDNSTFSYAQIDPECQKFFTNTDGKAYAKEAGDYTVYLKVKTVEGVTSASIWVNFVKDYDVDFTNIFMSYGEVGDEDPTVVTQKVETGTNEVRFIIPSAEAGTVVAFGTVEEGQSTPLSVDADEDEGNNLEPLGGGNGSFSVKTGGTAIEVYLKAVGENQFKVWAAGYEDYRPDLYVRGTAVGGWDNTKYRFAVPTQEDQAGVIENIKLEEGEFKIASKDWSNSWGWWGYQIGDDWIDVKEEGQGNLVQGEARANFAAVAESNNIKCNVAGYYNLYMMKNNYLYITAGEGPEEEEKVFSVKLGEATPVALVENEGAALAENQTGEYMLAEPIDLTIGTVLEFYSDETKIAEHIGADEGSNVELNEGVYTIKASKADAQIYLKTWKDGGYSFYVEGPKADGVYLEKKVEDEYVPTMMAQDEEALEGYDFSFRLKAEAEVGDIFRGVYVATFVEGIQDEDVYDGSNCIIETAETLEVEGNDIKVKAAGKYEFVIGIKVVDHVDTIHVYANPVNLTEVDFETDYDVGNGNSVYVVGNFTNWKIDPAFKLDYDNETHSWKGTFEFEDGDYEYKFVKAATEDPGTEVAQGNWLSPNNIEFSVPEKEPEPEPEVVYTVKLGENDAITLVKNEEAELAENQTAEYMLPQPIDMVKDAAIVFSADGIAIPSLGNDGGNVVETEGGFAIKANKKAGQIYFKTWADGGYSFYVEEDMEDGVYLQALIEEDSFATLPVEQDQTPLDGYLSSYRIKLKIFDGASFRGLVLETDPQTEEQASTIYDADKINIMTPTTLEANAQTGLVDVKEDGIYDFIIAVKMVEQQLVVDIYANPVNLTEVDFETDYDVGNGNSVYVVGNFTNWKIDPAFKLDYDNETHSWKGTFEFADGDYEYKFVKAATEDPGTEVAQGNWLSPNNIEFSVPEKEPEPEPEVVYTAKIGEADYVTISDVKPDGNENNAIFIVPLAKDETLKVKANETNLHFYHYDQEAIDDGETYTAAGTATYIIYVNSQDQMWPGIVETEFSITHDTGDGKSVYVAGSWDGWAGKTKLGWHDGNVWSGVVENLEPGLYEFKYIIADTNEFANADWTTLNSNNRTIYILGE